jgi:16S rRNA (adenine1518-N6/adenine1519-N6)-dimethyltransferase
LSFPWDAELQGPETAARSMSFAAHRVRKRFGQHWLIDQGVLERIVVAAGLVSGDRVLEVGPGRGSLTERLLASPAAAVLAVELDRDLVVGLQGRFSDEPRFSLTSGDVLGVELPAANKVVANIPYNITGPLLERLVGRLDRPVARPYERLVLLVQREVGERIRCLPGSSAYSALSVRMQLMARCQLVCAVPPRCFQPPPKVHSEVILIEPLGADQQLEPGVARTVEMLLKRCFGARRKMLRNTLAGLLPEPKLAAMAAAAGIGMLQRPQEIAPGAWVVLAGSLNQACKAPAQADSHG